MPRLAPSVNRCPLRTQLSACISVVIDVLKYILYKDYWECHVEVNGKARFSMLDEVN